MVRGVLVLVWFVCGVGAEWTKRRAKSWMRSRTTDVDIGESRTGGKCNG